MVARLFWRRQRRLRETGKAAKLYLYGLWPDHPERTGQSLFSHTMPEMRGTHGLQIRKRTVTVHIGHE